LTPEGKVKAAVKRILDKYKARYEFWPVPSGYGASSLDCIICFHGMFAAVETKRPGGKPTNRQKMVIRQITAAGGAVFVIDGENGELERLIEWLEQYPKQPAKE
jgi:hypothetical protein